MDLNFAKVNNDKSKEDQKFFEYGNEIIDYAKKKGRSTYPIEKVITVRI